MNAGAVTPSRLRPQLEHWLGRARAPADAVFAIHHEGEWAGADQILVADYYVDVRVCPSELAIREALVGRPENGRPLVLLTPVEHVAVDVEARLTKQRVVRLDPSEALLPLFGVQAIDARIASERWLVDALIEAQPRDGYPRTGARLLDAERAWRELLRVRYDLDVDVGDDGLVRWADGDRASALLDAPADERAAVADRLARRFVAGPGVVAALSARRGGDVAALGLVARLLVSAPESTELAVARSRFALLLGDASVPEHAEQAWVQAAERVAREATDAGALLARADALARELQAGGLLAASALLPGGLRARQQALGERIAAWLGAGGATAPVDEAAERVADHDAGGEESPGEVAAHAARLVRRLSRATDQPTTFVAAARDYAVDGAYVDWARVAIREASGEPDLDAALRELAERADALRRAQERRFVKLLEPIVTNATPVDGVLGVEALLDAVVAPLAAQRPVCVVVLDGMGHRVAAELMADLARRGWTELRAAGASARQLVLSVLPSVTAVSRTSLLTGALDEGVAKDEGKAFTAHPGLVRASAATAPPRLFHKGAVRDAHGGLSAKLRDELAGERRVVGVVINAIDDHLARSDQLRTPWSVRDVPPLRWTLDAAREQNRIVVVLSDHGHVLDLGDGDARRLVGEGGERWRAADRTAAGDGEVLLEGPRVLAGDGRCILAADERVRYGPPKHGYHGGATAQEVLAPVLVLVPGLSEGIAGFTEVAHDPPSWWMPSGQAPANRPSAPTPTAVGGQLSLDASTPGWIEALLASELWRAQRAGAGRAQLAEERAVAILTAIDARGRKILPDALAAATGIPAQRLPGVLAALRAMLNVDGFQVLAIDESTGDVILDRALLAEQFGV